VEVNNKPGDLKLLQVFGGVKTEVNKEVLVGKEDRN